MGWSPNRNVPGPYANVCSLPGVDIRGKDGLTQTIIKSVCHISIGKTASWYIATTPTAAAAATTTNTLIRRNGRKEGGREVGIVIKTAKRPSINRRHT